MYDKSKGNEMRHITFRHVCGDVVLESDLVIARKAAWDKSLESGDPAWAVVSLGGFLFALRMDDATCAPDLQRGIEGTATRNN